MCWTRFRGMRRKKENVREYSKECSKECSKLSGGSGGDDKADESEKTLRYWYEAHLMAIRDRYGEDEYIRDPGREPNALQECIQTETNLQVLSKWLKTPPKQRVLKCFDASILATNRTCRKILMEFCISDRCKNK